MPGKKRGYGIPGGGSLSYHVAAAQVKSKAAPKPPQASPKTPQGVPKESRKTFAKEVRFLLGDQNIIYNGEKCGFGITNLGVQMLSIPIWDHLVIPNLPDPLECVSYTKYF